ncbi:aquaporin-11-like isoform X2 [Littorina saxatilis]|uniref:aquaporin-11-like isoform X2 n=1 Tax=Littorina saxatilis TaxID=31220 RepID=UPI0038B5FCCC
MKQVTMSLKTAWATVSGQPQVPLLVGSLLVYSLAFMICLSLQRSFRLILPPALYSYAADFFFTMAVCAYPYAHGTVRTLFGHVGYVVTAVTLVTITCLVFEGTPSPLGVFRRYLEGEESMLGLGVRVLLQILAACLSYRLVSAIWSLEVNEEHCALLKRTACESDLHVPVVLGFLIEFSAVLYDTWLSHQQLVKSSVVDSIIKSINGALLVCAGVDMTGMYMHPAMATGMTFNCQGTDIVEHIFAYWISTFLGVYAGVELSRVFRLHSSAATDKKKAAGGQMGNGRLDKSRDNNDANVKQRKKLVNLRK